ncbi:MAG: UDP-N-acetylmuramoyl-L-alanine--D-glutamate ligase [Verrucomicrobiota bacterium]
MSTLETHLKRVSVLGAGESGISAALLLAAEGHAVTVHDTAAPETLPERAAKLSAAGIVLRGGAEAVTVPEGTQLAVLSPGIALGSPLVEAFRSALVPVVGELELAFERCKCPVVAVTGTNGKTTTTQLIEAMFKGAGVATEACGNIGPAFSAKVGESGALSVMTVEVSSFQLETIERFHPKVAVWLNFAPDHLDRYASMEEYYEAKLRIFERQTENDWAVVNARDNLPQLKARTLRFNAHAPGADFSLVDGVIQFLGEPVLRMSDTHLVGLHNAENLMAALATGFAWGLDWAAMRPALCAYRALPHRCEVVGESLGVQYVNDSKATNLDAVEKALASETRKVVLIAGGKDKGFEFESLTGLVAQRCRSAVLIGEMAARISDQWSGALECQRAGSLSEAVALARAAAQPGDVVLFSPGSSSFDMFANYADRGNQFRALVRQFSP